MNRTQRPRGESHQERLPCRKSQACVPGHEEHLPHLLSRITPGFRNRAWWNRRTGICGERQWFSRTCQRAVRLVGQPTPEDSRSQRCARAEDKWAEGRGAVSPPRRGPAARASSQSHHPRPSPPCWLSPRELSLTVTPAPRRPAPGRRPAGSRLRRSVRPTRFKAPPRLRPAPLGGLATPNRLPETRSWASDPPFDHWGWRPDPTEQRPQAVRCQRLPQ